MNDRKRGAIVVAGLWLAVGGGCKGDESPPDSGEGEATPAPAEAEGSAKTAEGDETKAAPEPEPPPPPVGHAVAKPGALLFTSSTGQVGVELPPMSGGGFTVNVVGAQDGRLVLETLSAQPPEHHCASSLAGLQDFRLRLFMAEDDLLPVLTQEVVELHEDGTRIQVMRGVPVPEGEGATELTVLGATVPLLPTAEVLGKTYEPGPAFPTTAGEGTLQTLEGHPLTVGGKPISEPGLTERFGALVLYGQTPKEGTGQTMVKVRNACLEYEALVDDARLEARAKAGLYAIEGGPGRGTASAGILGALAAEEGHFLGAAPFGATELRSDEDVWGGLTGTETGEAFGVGGLGLVGTGRGGPGAPSYEVKTGTSVLWSDGSAAGQVTADHRFTEAPRDEGGRSCFDVSLLKADSPSLTLCFAPGDVSEIAGTGLGTIGLGNTGLIGKGGGGGTGSGYGTGSGGGFGGRGTKVPRVRQAKATVKGSLDKDIIRRIVRAHINEVRFCYNQGLVRDPALEGRVEINFVIDAAGKVPSATVASDTLSDEKVGKCMAKAVKRWKFPRPTGGGVVVVTYPFELSPG